MLENGGGGLETAACRYLAEGQTFRANVIFKKGVHADMFTQVDEKGNPLLNSVSCREQYCKLGKSYE